MPRRVNNALIHFNKMNNLTSPIRKLSISFLLVVFISFNSFSQSKNEPSIKGKLQLDSIWSPVVYLSHIPTFKDMYTMSNEMIIAKANVDDFGNFFINTEALPENDNLYRLHLSKKEAPPASLIIGGKEENHVFLIANSKVSITLANDNTNGIFGAYTFSNYQPNKDLGKINAILLQSRIADSSSNSVKREFIEKKLNEELRHIADSSAHPLVSLYALNHSKFESTFLSNQLFYENYLKKWKDENSTYFTELRTKLPQQKSSSPILYIILGLVFFALGFIINHIYVLRKKKNKNHLKALSVQERKIFQLIQCGKSNKEISEEYNIGLSTVKSHVSNIYSKLNIKSRKEAMDIN